MKNSKKVVLEFNAETGEAVANVDKLNKEIQKTK